MSSIEHLITVADLANYPDDDGNRYELIEGELFVSTAPWYSSPANSAKSPSRAC